MNTCKDCIHETVCSALIKKGLPWADGIYPADAFCMAFRNKSDFVEIVRCKDCEHIEMTEYGGFCCAKDEGVAYDGYCAYGKRKGGE